LTKVIHTDIVEEDKIIKILEDEGYFNIFKWCDREGSYYMPHTHPYYEVRWIISGELKIIEPDREVILKAGDRYESMPNIEHSAQALSDVCYICGSKEI